MLAAASVSIGVSEIVLSFKERASKLPEYDISNMTNLSDYALSVWYLQITATAAAEASRALEEQVFPRRRKLLSWATPLAEAGLINQQSLDKIREGSGLKDGAADLVALSALYRVRWDEIKGVCGVTEQEVDEAAKIGTAVFAAQAKRENQPAQPASEEMLRLRKAWTLLDRAYQQCRRAVTYFRFVEGDADTLVPSLRRNLGRPATSAAHPETPAATTPASPSATPAEPPIGGGSGPFINK